MVHRPLALRPRRQTASWPYAMRQRRAPGERHMPRVQGKRESGEGQNTHEVGYEVLGAVLNDHVRVANMIGRANGERDVCRAPKCSWSGSSVTNTPSPVLYCERDVSTGQHQTWRRTHAHRSELRRREHRGERGRVAVRRRGIGGRQRAADVVLVLCVDDVGVGQVRSDPGRFAFVDVRLV
jgi:hypothetical protein